MTLPRSLAFQVLTEKKASRSVSKDTDRTVQFRPSSPSSGFAVVSPTTPGVRAAHKRHARRDGGSGQGQARGGRCKPTSNPLHEGERAQHRVRVNRCPERRERAQVSQKNLKADPHRIARSFPRMPPWPRSCPDYIARAGPCLASYAHAPLRIRARVHGAFPSIRPARRSVSTLAKACGHKVSTGG